MCGLFGIAKAEPLNESELQCADTARDVLSHRGPDHAGKWVQSGLYVGHRRLSIIDTSPAGRQPMVAGQIVVTVNGEIYNYRDLREELKRQGCIFSSNSDSEVVLHGFRQWGIEKLVQQLDGMYAAVTYVLLLRRPPPNLGV
jgi:asparagine synthase (glutamine-hydrolysing)